LGNSEYDDLVSWGRKVSQGDSFGKCWTLGDLAERVRDHFGLPRLPQFAADIGIGYPELRRMRRVALAYPYATSYRYACAWSIYCVLAAQPDRDELVLTVQSRREAAELVTARAGQRSPAPAVWSNADWIPDGSDRRGQAAMRRREIIADMAARGCTSRQIAEKLGISDEATRRIAGQNKIKLKANRALAGTHFRRDANHMLDSITGDLAAIRPSCDMLDPAELDPAKMRDWLTILRATARDLNELARRLERHEP
jgi:hypothetical protein